MFIALLEFSDNKARAGQFMEGHKQWIKRGFEDGVFLLVGSLQPNMGGAPRPARGRSARSELRPGIDPGL
jgi:hypothetical protein